MATPTTDPSSPPPARPRWALRLLALVAVVWMLREAQPLLAPVMVAVVLTFLLTPLVRWLRRRLRVPEVLGAAFVVAALVGTVVPVAGALAEPATVWWQRAPQTLAQLLERFDRLRAAVPGLGPAPAPTQGTRPTRPAPPQPDPVKERLASESVALTGMLLNRGIDIAVSGAATVILLYFLLASEHWLLSRTIEAVPRRRSRALVLGGVRAAQREIGRYLGSLGLINIGVATVTGLAMWWLGLPNPTLWGALGGLLNFIPYIGPLILFALLLLAGVFAFPEASAMVAPALAFAAINAVENNLVSPWIVGRRLALSPISVFLSVMFWGWLWGVAGALIAVPMLIIVRCVCVRNRRLRILGRFIDGDARPTPSIRTLLGSAVAARRVRTRAAGR